MLPIVISTVLKSIVVSRVISQDPRIPRAIPVVGSRRSLRVLRSPLPEIRILSAVITPHLTSVPVVRRGRRDRLRSELLRADVEAASRRSAVIIPLAESGVLPEPDPAARHELVGRGMQIGVLHHGGLDDVGLAGGAVAPGPRASVTPAAGDERRVARHRGRGAWQYVFLIGIGRRRQHARLVLAADLVVRRRWLAPLVDLPTAPGCSRVVVPGGYVAQVPGVPGEVVRPAVRGGVHHVPVGVHEVVLRIRAVPSGHRRDCTVMRNDAGRGRGGGRERGGEGEGEGEGGREREEISERISYLPRSNLLAGGREKRDRIRRGDCRLQNCNMLR